jgi:hypothetical protein
MESGPGCQPVPLTPGRRWKRSPAPSRPPRSRGAGRNP